MYMRLRKHQEGMQTETIVALGYCEQNGEMERWNGEL